MVRLSVTPILLVWECEAVVVEENKPPVVVEV